MCIEVGKYFEATAMDGRTSRDGSNQTAGWEDVVIQQNPQLSFSARIDQVMRCNTELLCQVEGWAATASQQEATIRQLEEELKASREVTERLEAENSCLKEESQSILARADRYKTDAEESDNSFSEIVKSIGAMKSKAFRGS
jgi:hypothetical protein